LPTILVTPPPTEPTTTGVSVATVVGKSSPVLPFGCTTSTGYRAVNANTDPFQCSLGSDPVGLEITPFHKQRSKVHGVRVYSSKHYPAYDPVSYVLEGRADSSSPWQLVSQGDFPWISENAPGRNPSGIDIVSSYASGDLSRSFTEASFPGNDAAYLDYKITLATRSGSTLKFAEVEMPGLVMASMTTYEAEDETIGSGGYVYSDSGVTYVKLDASGSYVEFAGVDAGSGGTCVLSVRYSNGGAGDRAVDVSVNGSPVGSMTMAVGLSWRDWQNAAIETVCAPGLNVVRLTRNGGDVNLDSLTLYK